MATSGMTVLVALAALLATAPHTLCGQEQRIAIDVAAGGGNVGGGMFSTEAKFVANATLSIQQHASPSPARLFGAFSVERYFGNEGGGYCSKHDSLGQCMPRPPALLGGVALVGAQWHPLNWFALAMAGGGGVFRSGGSGAATSPSIQARAELIVGAGSQIAMGLRGEQGRLTGLAGNRIGFQSLTLFLRGQ